MRVQIIARRMTLTIAERDLIRRRIAYAFSRFGQHVQRISVRLADQNGPRGGVDTTCRAVARLTPKGELAVELTDVDVERSASRAVDRLSRRVTDELQRRRRVRGTGLRQLSE